MKSLKVKCRLDPYSICFILAGKKRIKTYQKLDEPDDTE